MTKLMMKYVNETKEYVIEIMTSEYNFDEIRANDIVKKSSFSKLLNEDPLYVMHYNVEYWVEKVLQEHQRTYELR